MRDTLLYLISKIVEHNEDIKVNEVNEDSRITFSIRVHPEDMGKIIGKNGRIIRAIRDVIKIIAAKNNTYIDIVLT